MTALRQIVKDAFKCEELCDQYENIDVSDGHISSPANAKAEVNEKYSDTYLVQDAVDRLDICVHNIKDLTRWDGSVYDKEGMRAWKRQAAQLRRFLKKHKR